MSRREHIVVSDEDDETFYVMRKKGHEIVSGPHPSRIEALQNMIDVIYEVSHQDVMEVWGHHHEIEFYTSRLIEMLAHVATRHEDADAARVAEKLMHDYDRGKGWYQRVRDFIIEDGTFPEAEALEEVEET